MGLESGNTIRALNASWPSGTDDRSQGDDHIRLIKRTLLNCFPNITGPITLTQDEINRGSIPRGSATLFYNTAPPVGWARIEGLTDVWGIRVVPAGWSSGTASGSHPPDYNDKIPTHTHAGYAVDGSTSAWVPRMLSCIPAIRL